MSPLHSDTIPKKPATAMAAARGSFEFNVARSRAKHTRLRRQYFGYCAPARTAPSREVLRWVQELQVSTPLTKAKR